MRKFAYQQACTLVSSLVLRWSVDAVYTGLEPATGEMGDGVCQIHGDGAWLSRNPGPVAIFAQDLKAGDGLAEEESDSPDHWISSKLL